MLKPPKPNKIKKIPDTKKTIDQIINSQKLEEITNKKAYRNNLPFIKL